ncbi:MAG: alpha/beta fold hydrolase [Bacteroidota bacterium]
MKDTKISVNGIDLHLLDFGGAEHEETILCVHGLTSNCRIWDAVAERLVDRYHVIAIDLRGRGDSQKPWTGYRIPQHVEDVRALLDELGLEKVIYLGHSLGASIGVAFATTHPERLSRLILVDGGADVPDTVFELLKPSIDRLGKVSPSFGAYLEPLLNGPFFPEWNAYIEQHYYHDVQHHPDGSVSSKVRKEAIEEEIDALQKFSLNTLHPRITVPTLVFWSPGSLMHPTIFVLTEEKGKAIAAGIPQGRFVEIPESNHFTILLTHYEETVRATKQFLEETKNQKSQKTLARV